MNNNLKLNSEGYPDPTACAALKSIEITDERANTIIKSLKNLIRLAGFETIDCIKIRDRKTGREFR